MLALFADESSDDRSYAVCGVLAKVGAWDRFVVKWNGILANPHSLPYWHQSDAYARTAPFDQLSEKQIERREVLLSSALRSINPRIGASLMLARNYDEIKGEWLQNARFKNRRDRDRWDSQIHPYCVLHATWIERLQRTMPSSTEPVLIFLEESNDRRRDADAIFCIKVLEEQSVVIRGYPKRVHMIAAVPGKNPDFRPLEAADLAAWAVRRHWIGRAPHHLVNRVLRQRHPVEYFEIKTEEIRGFFQTIDQWRSVNP